MSEIKFRGKRVDNNEWVYGYLVRDWNNTPYIITNFGPNITACMECGANEMTAYEVIPETVGQFTGIEDKNGTEIYVGDKVKAFNGIREVIGIVRFGRYEQDGSGGEYGPTDCIGFYIDMIEIIPNEWEREEGIIYKPDDYEKTNSLLAYEYIEILNN